MKQHRQRTVGNGSQKGDLKSQSGKKPLPVRVSRRQTARGSQLKPGSAKRKKQSSRTQSAKVKGFAAINRVRGGESRTLSEAAEAEGTSVKTIRRLLPAALIPARKGERIRVKAGDTYSWPVKILTENGPVVVKARGSRERVLAGQHRAIYMQVLRGKLPPAALSQFQGKKVGGQELLGDYDRLSVLAQAGILGQLETLYVSPGAGI